MKRLLIGLLLAMFLGACRSAGVPQTDTTEGARIAAKVYYEALANGQYEQFLNGREYAQDMPEDYRRQMVEGYQQFMRQQRQAHGDIVSIEATEAIADTSLHVVQVMLSIGFSDNLHEEIVVPMVFDGEQWLMH